MPSIFNLLDNWLLRWPQKSCCTIIFFSWFIAIVATLLHILAVWIKPASCLLFSRKVLNIFFIFVSISFIIIRFGCDLRWTNWNNWINYDSMDANGKCTDESNDIKDRFNKLVATSSWNWFQFQRRFLWIFSTRFAHSRLFL